MNELQKKENELAIGTLVNAILEKEVRILRKKDEIERIEIEIINAREKLAEKQGK